MVQIGHTLIVAIKATYGEITHKVKDIGYEMNEDGYYVEPREIWKDPVTDDGVKRSAKGLLRIELEDGKYVLYDQQTWMQEQQGCLETVFKDGNLVKEWTLDEIRKRLKESL